MQHLPSESTLRETAFNAAQATATAAPQALSIPADVVVALRGGSESQDYRESTQPTQLFEFRYGRQPKQQDQKQIHQGEQRRKGHLLPQISSPLVLKGRVRYSFATRTVEGCQHGSVNSGPVHPDNINSTSTARGNLRSCSGGSGGSRKRTSSSATSASHSLGGCAAPHLNSVADNCPRELNGLEASRTSHSGRSSTWSSNASGESSSGGDGIINCITRSSQGGYRSPSDCRHMVPPPSPGAAARSVCLVVAERPAEGACRSVCSSGIDISSSTNRKNSRDNKNIGGNSSSISCGAEKEERIPVLSASDIAVLLRDYAAFVQRTERQLHQLQRLVQQQQVTEFEYDEPQQEQQCPASVWVGSCGLSSTDKIASVRHEQQQQLGEAEALRQLIAEGAVVCRSLHSRLRLLLVDSPSTTVAAAGSELLLGKLRRDFLQQQQQYSRLLRLLSSAAGLLREPPDRAHQSHVAATASSISNTSNRSSRSSVSGLPAAGAPARIVWHSGHRGSPCSLPVDCLHFENPERRRQSQGIKTQGIIHPSEGYHLGSSSVRAGNSPLQQTERSLWLHGSTGTLPPLFIGPSDARASAAEDSPQDDLWEPAALIEVHEDYEKQQIISERKQQLQQLRQVEQCVTVLRELQLHVAADVEGGSQRLHAVEEETEAAENHTAAGVGELAAAARSKTRWWGVQGGGAAALLGVSVGAVAGGPIGAAVGAIVGAVAGLSSGAALRGRHRERVNAAERSVRRRRAQRLKRCPLTPATGGMNSIPSTASRVATPGSADDASGSRMHPGGIDRRPLLWNFEGGSYSSSGARRCGAPATTGGQHPRTLPQAAGLRGGATGPSGVPSVGWEGGANGPGVEAKGAVQTGQSKLAAGRRRQKPHRNNPRRTAAQSALGAAGILPVFQFFPG
ncbi:hypothetical protein, conserved [Eimeria brunetti]|uniref:Ppg3 n=1 Tax=Eimeria brunetti TaxID=51314 RepID=U6L855_9EIME|nr:hypothetical protein, conserved [Eimeria brunetti]